MVILAENEVRVHLDRSQKISKVSKSFKLSKEHSVPLIDNSFNAGNLKSLKIVSKQFPFGADNDFKRVRVVVFPSTTVPPVPLYSSSSSARHCLIISI